MRRLAFAAVCGTLLLAACSDQQQSPTEPAAPAPDFNIGSCRLVRFPIVNVSGLIAQVFPKGRLRTEALLRAAAVALLWDTCHPAAARKVAVDFVNWIDLNAPGTAPAGKVLELKIAVLNGVEIPASAPAGSPADFGVGTYDPSNPNKTLVKTNSGTALVELEPGSFNELTTIVVSRKSDGFTLTNFGGNQFPPYFDYDAINASGNHVLNTGHPAIVAFCLLNSDIVTYPANRRIGHNPVAGAPGFPFEMLDPVDLVEGRPDLAAALNCGNLAPTPGSIGFFGNGLPGFATAAWHTTGRYLGPIAQAVFLPQPLEATALTTLPPPIGGHASSLSPFGVVEVSTSEIELWAGDPAGKEFTVGEPLDSCNDGCFPEFRVLNGGVPVTTSSALTVTLVPADAGSVGDLSGTTTKSTSTTSPYTARFDDLIVSAPGSYRLVVSAPGAKLDTTGAFTVLPPPIPTSFGSTDWSYKQISNFDPVPGEWLTIDPTAAGGWATGSAPFGTPGCELATPSTLWSQNTTILLRRDVFIPENTAFATIDILIDNDVFAFVNGWGVDGGGVLGSGCADAHPVQFTVAASTTGEATAGAPLLSGRVNKIFIRGVDTGIGEGSQSYLDAKITLTPVTP